MENEIVERKKIIIHSPDTIMVEDKDDIISKYVTPMVGCVCCSTPGFAIKINEAFLGGMNFRQILDEFYEKVLVRTGKKLTMAMLSDHFATHFNFKGAAIAEYNSAKAFNKLPSQEIQGIRDIFTSLTVTKVNDLEMLEMSMREQIKRLKELEELKIKRFEEGRTNNIENLIMKQEQIVNNIQANIITKLKTFSKAMVQSKRAELMDRQLNFLDSKTAQFFGDEVVNPATAKKIEKLYLKVVIENLMKRVVNATNYLQIDQHDKMSFFKELQKQFVGIENDINKDFKERVETVRDEENGDVKIVENED